MSIEGRPIAGFLDDLASESATPGGGSAAAIMGAMAAALVSMVCNLTIGKVNYRDVEEELGAVRSKAERFRRELTAMIEQDVKAFEEVMRAYAMPRRTSEEVCARSQAIQAALKEATLVPLRCCRTCQEIIDLSAIAADKGNRNVVSDAGVAVLAADAGLRGAALNVFINVRAIKDTAFVEENRKEVNQLLTYAAAATQSTYERVKAKLG
jgi:formiminotetrahydrofolate cyclodeaminase